MRIPLFLSLFCWLNISYAIEDFRDVWRGIYPTSNADDISNGNGCQLCHVNVGGGAPWNSYGWSVRQIYLNNGFNISDAINIAADLDQDNDLQSANSGDEINSSFQPGWTVGDANTIYAADGTPSANQAPPALPPTTDLDFPSPVTNPLADIPNGSIAVDLYPVAAGFNAPVQAVVAPGVNGSLFVIEQTGKIFRVDLASGSKSLFLNVTADLVNLNSGNDERGLLGLAFHPNYATNGLFYTYQSEPKRAEQDNQVDYSTVAPSSNFNHRTMIVAYRARDPSCNSSIQKIDNLLIIDQPQSNHNGGDLAFGADGFLYIALGDGGGARDRGFGHGSNGNSRNNTNPLGSILRIDPNGNNSANGKYAVPPDNPFVALGNTGVDEIFAYGFRNPYRISIDADNGDLYVGDVGQGQIEEINLVTIGENYGWNWKEGSYYFYNSNSTGNFISNVAPPGAPLNLVDPVAQYDHDDGVSVIGGYVYRGSQIPALQGSYVFGEFLKRLFYLEASQDIKEFLGSGTSEFVTGFGQDAENELYVLTRVQSGTTGTNGKLQKIIAPDAAYYSPDGNDESAICPPSDDLCLPIKSSNGKVAVICL